MDTISLKVSDGGKDYRPLFHCKPDNLYDTVRSYLCNQFPDLKDVPFELGYTDYDDKFTVVKNSQELVEAHERHQTQSVPPAPLLALHAKKLSSGESRSANAPLGLLHDDALPLLNELEFKDLHSPSSFEVPDQQPASLPNPPIVQGGEKKSKKRKRNTYRKSSPTTRRAVDSLRAKFEKAQESKSKEGPCPALCCEKVSLSAAHKKYWKTIWVRHLLNSCPTFSNKIMH